MPSGRARVRLLRREHEAEPLARHAVDHLRRARVRGGVVAEGAIEERLGLRRQAVPVDRRAEHDAVGGEEVVQEQAAEPVLDVHSPVAPRQLRQSPRKWVMWSARKRTSNSPSRWWSRAPRSTAASGPVAARAGAADEDEEPVRAVGRHRLGLRRGPRRHSRVGLRRPEAGRARRRGRRPACGSPPCRRGRPSGPPRSAARCRRPTPRGAPASRARTAPRPSPRSGPRRSCRSCRTVRRLAEVLQQEAPLHADARQPARRCGDWRQHARAAVHGGAVGGDLPARGDCARVARVEDRCRPALEGRRPNNRRSRRIAVAQPARHRRGGPRAQSCWSVPAC